MTDYRTLLADAMWHMGSAGTEADAALATRVPWLCPDCKGTGIRPCTNCDEDCSDDPCKIDGCLYGPTQCTHPNAPTIADLLKRGENVAKARVVKDHLDHSVGCVHVGDYCLDADDVGLLAALRGEGQ